MTDSLETRGQLAFAGLLGLYAASIPFATTPAAAAIASLPLLVVPLGFWLIGSPDRWMYCFLGAALLLPPLPFAVGNSGPHPALAVAAAGALIGLLHFDEWRIRLDILPVSMLLLLAVLHASVAFAFVYSGLAVGAGSLARVALVGISVYVFLYVSWGPSARRVFDSFAVCRWLFAAGVAAAVFAIIDFFYQLPTPAGFGPQFVWLDSGIYRRAQGLFYEASTLGNFCAFFLVMVAAGLLSPARERVLARRWLWSGGALLALALILSYSRASLVNLAAALATLLFLNRSRLNLRRLLGVASACAAGGALLAGTAFPEFAQLYWARLWASGQYLFSATGAVLSGRLDNWRTLSDFLLAHPWHGLLGVGYKTLPYSDFTGTPTIGDNMYLTLLLETGVVGLGSCLLLLAAILRASLHAARNPKPRSAFLGAWSFSFWVGEILQMFSGDLLTYWRVLPVYFLILALAVREGESS
jgi:hypothetical protein